MDAMDAAANKAKEGNSNDMDLQTSVSDKRARDLEEPLPPETTVEGNNEKRPRAEALEIAYQVDLDVVRKNAQWWSPELKPRDKAPQSSVAEGVKSAVSAWVADGRKRVLGQGLLPDEEKVHADLVQEANLRELAARITRSVMRVMSRRRLRKRGGYRLGKWRMGRKASRPDSRPRAFSAKTFRKVSWNPQAA